MRGKPSVALAKKGGRASENFAKIPPSIAPRSFIRAGEVEAQFIKPMAATAQYLII
jgi:hypothetical protein